MNDGKYSIDGRDAICLYCRSTFDMKTRNGIPIDPIGPYCHKRECRAEYDDQCVALYDMELSYAAQFAMYRDVLEIISDYPDRAMQIVKLIKETAPWYPAKLSREAAQNWELLNARFCVFEKATRVAFGI